MAAKNVKEVLKGVSKEIEPSKEDLSFINRQAKETEREIRSQIKLQGIKASVFRGGSFAKGTLIKKGKYDIDLFIRFGREYYNKDVSYLTESLLKNFSNLEKVHGSRDYFRLNVSKKLVSEIIPTLKISKPSDAVNVTDLSYTHVRYIKNKEKSKEILEDIKLAKAFCHGTRTYGAESYISGFSGYSLELLIYYYGSFVKFLRNLSKDRDEKLIIDMEKHYRTKKEILLDINASKLNAPVILIDPTYKERNALAALSEETFTRFKKEAKAFLEEPSKDFFEERRFDPQKFKSQANKSGHSFLLLGLKTEKQEGNVAGSKMLKFHKYLMREISKHFELKKEDFEYDGHKASNSILIAKPKEKIVFKGPSETDKENLKKFKSKHSKVFFENERAYAEEESYSHLENFLKDWIKNNQGRLKEMDIKEISIKDSNKN